MTNAETLKAVTNAIAHLAAAAALLDPIGEGHILSPISAARDTLDRYRESLETGAESRRRRFDEVPVLQAALRFRDGSTRRVAVSKPSAEIDDPHIGEMFYSALVRQGVTACLEDFPIAVVGKRGKVIAEIPIAETGK